MVNRQQIQAWIEKWFWTVVITAVLALTVGILAYRAALGVWPAWTGFGDYTGPLAADQRGKTLWDWIGILVVPVALGLGAVYFNRQERKSEQMIAENRNQNQILQTYFDRMNDLLLKYSLLNVGPLVLDWLRQAEDDAQVNSGAAPARKPLRKADLEKLLPEGLPVVWSMAQVRTVTALRLVDAPRRSTIFQFLRDSDLNGFLLISASLHHVDLSNNDLSQINLRGAHLTEANLSGSKLFEACLIGAHMFQTNLAGAHLFKADLTRAHLYQANLSGAYLHKADLVETYLREARLDGANLTGANLTGANLIEANLVRAIVTPEQLAQAASLTGAILPDGTVHE